MRVAIVHNASAGKSGITRKHVVRALVDAGHEVLDDDAAEEQSPDVVVVAGGDGTVTRSAIELAKRDLPMAILPLGTANNMARGVGLVPSNDPLAQLVALIGAHEERRFDLGVVEDRRGTRWFSEGAGVGLFAEALERVFTEDDKEPPRAAAALARFVETHRASHYDVELDEVDASGEYVMVEVLNVPLFGPNLRLGPDADPFDGRLDVALVTEAEVATLHAYLEAIAAGQKPAAPKVDVHRAERVRLRYGDRPLRIDGELHDESSTAATVRVVPGAARLWTPVSATAWCFAPHGG